MADAAAVIADILQGHFDAELVELAEALATRRDSGEVDVAWRVQLGDLVIDKHEMTIGEVLELDALGETRETIDPARSEMGRMKVLLAHYMAVEDITAGEASKWLNAEKFDAIKVTEYVVGGLPKDGSDPTPS